MTSRIGCRCLAALLGLGLAMSAHGATVTGLGGVSVSIYDNPFDPNLDYNAAETSFAYGDPTLGAPGAWTINTGNSPLHAVDRQDGRNYYDSGASAWIYNTSNTSGPPAFLQYTAPDPFTVGTIITAHSLSFSTGIVTGSPFDLRFSTGSPGTTAAAWSSITPVTSGPGTPNTHPISVYSGPPVFTADTMRISYSKTTTVTSLGESDAMMQEVVVLPDRLYEIPTTVTAFSSAGPVAGGAGVNDKQGGVTGINAGIWYDITGAPITSKFVELTLTGGPKTVAALVFFTDNGITGQALNIRADGVLVAHVDFASSIGEVLPIRFDNPFAVSVLRFEWTAGNESGWAAMRDILVLGIPEPASLGVMSLGLLALTRRRRAA